MNKKIIAATIIIAVTMSATSAFAAGLKYPGGSKLGNIGDDLGISDESKDTRGTKGLGKKEKETIQVNAATKTELKLDNANSSKLKHEGKLYIDGKIDDMWTAEIGLNIETKTDNAKKSETEKWEMENVWLQYQTNPNFSLKFGRQTYHLGKGLYIDQDGVFGGKSIYKVDKDNTLELFVGRTDESRDIAGVVLDKNGKAVSSVASKTTLVEVVNLAHKFTGGGVGIFRAQQGTQAGLDNKFWGVYGDYDVAHRTNLNYEYLKNNTLDKVGYVAELKYGKLKKAGDYTFALEYMNVDGDLEETNKYTDYDSQIAKTPAGFKGPGAIAMTKLSKNSQLQLQRWWGVSKAGAKYSIPVTKLILEVKF